MQYLQSERLFERAKQLIPGGVNSPVRAFKSVGGNPIFIQSADGAYLFDADGNQFIDCINSWGPMILGHNHLQVTAAIQAQAALSSSYGAPTEWEVKMAEQVLSMVPNVDQIRMVNSGTEACMSAVRLARGFTGKDKIIKFAGCYHGHADCFLIQAGSGASTLGVPNSPGVPKGAAQDTLIANYNNLQDVDQLLDQYGDQIACFIVEPVAGNMGCILPAEGFLEGLRSRCDQHGILLVFDEVMTGFRLAAGGAQELYQVKADLVTYGKIIGGGLPVGAFGGRREIMDYLAPTGPVYQAGTLSGNPLAMAAGFTTLDILQSGDVYNSLNRKVERLEQGIRALIVKHGISCQVNRLGSMISMHFCEAPVVDFLSAKEGDNEYFKRFFHAMLNEGVYLPPSAYESWFLSDALSQNDLEHILLAIDRSLPQVV